MNNQIRLHCGDYRKAMHDVKADLMITSPPYNIGSKSERKDGSRKFGLYDAKSFGSIRDYPDNLPEELYARQMVQFLKWAANHLTKDGVLVLNHKLRHRDGRLLDPSEWFVRPDVKRVLTQIDQVVWMRNGTHNHCTKYMYQATERLYVFQKPGAKNPLNNRKSSNLPYTGDVWKIQIPRRNGHNAPFPLDLALGVIAAWSHTSDLVCDPFTGSGTSAVAAYHLSRRFEGAEILEKYHTMALDRLAKTMKESA